MANMTLREATAIMLANAGIGNSLYETYEATEKAREVVREAANKYADSYIERLRAERIDKQRADQVAFAERAAWERAGMLGGINATKSAGVVTGGGRMGEEPDVCGCEYCREDRMVQAANSKPETIFKPITAPASAVELSVADAIAKVMRVGGFTEISPGVWHKP